MVWAFLDLVTKINTCISLYAQPIARRIMAFSTSLFSASMASSRVVQLREHFFTGSSETQRRRPARVSRGRVRVIDSTRPFRVDEVHVHDILDGPFEERDVRHRTERPDHVAFRTIMPQNKKPPNQMFMKFNIPRSGLSKATENNCAAASNDQRVNAYIKMTCTKCGPYQATIRTRNRQRKQGEHHHERNLNEKV